MHEALRGRLLKEQYEANTVSIGLTHIQLLDTCSVDLLNRGEVWWMLMPALSNVIHCWA